MEITVRRVHHIHRDDLMKPDLLSETALIVGLFDDRRLVGPVYRVFSMIGG
jgi:hypothetical protein